MSHHIHLNVDVRGLLNQPKRTLERNWKGAFTVGGRKLMKADEIRSALMDELSKGHERLPMGDCDNFDYKKGCRGHDTNDEPGEENQ